MLNVETIKGFLSLPTVDDTQTAFASDNIFISETTAARWRSLENIDEVLVALEEEEEETSTRPSCWVLVQMKIASCYTWNREQEKFTMPN